MGFEAFVLMVVGVVLEKLALPFAEDLFAGKVKPPPAVMTDVHADPGVQKELQDDLEAQIAAGGR